MVIVGIVVLFVTPKFSKYASTHSPTKVMFALSSIAIPTFGTFSALLYAEVAEQQPTIAFPLFYVVEEVLVTLLMLVFWQSATLPTRSGSGFGIYIRIGIGRRHPTSPHNSRHATPLHPTLSRFAVAMVSFTKDEAKRLIGIVSMGAAFANLANG